MDRPICTVAVRVLCEFAAKTGDLDLRFTPSPTAQQGIAGHRTVAASRSPGYRSEVALSGRYRHLEVRGRADGFDAATGTLEEVKTFRGSLERMPDNHRQLHLAQATVYAYLLCIAESLPTIIVSLVYFDIGRQCEAPPIRVQRSVDELRVAFERLCERFIDWADRESDHRAARDVATASLAFPHRAFRRGQRELAEAVYRAARRGACLTAQAPTGIGKTLATLFPLVKALGPERLDKVFFLTAKGTGRRLAIEALASLAPDGRGVPLRVVELTARDKACEHPDRHCHGASCPLASGFYDRLPAARSAAVDEGRLDRATIRRVALEHAVCPYHLAQDLVQWSDVVVGDYNHFFDAHAALHAGTVANGWRVAVLVDEAHNLVDRARAMYTAALHSTTLDATRTRLPPAVRGPLDRARRAWRRLVDDHDARYTVVERCPRDLATALQETASAMAEMLFDDPVRIDAALLPTYFALLQFNRVVDTFGAHSLFDIARDDDGSTTLCVRNVAPAPFLRPRFDATRTTTLFSATLAPRAFYANLLGVPDAALEIDVAAPFEAGQLSVHVVSSISTRFHDRERSLLPIARVIAERYRAAPGNYLAFFSSHAYLARALAAFRALAPDVAVWAQRRAMNDADRDAFLAAFVPDGRGIGFAVLGGAFAEGVDLVGTRLIGAFIATLGLPEVNPVNEEFRRRTDALFGAGYDYTYLYPGLRKVSQAAGRVIRTLSDRGSVHLIDDRFERPEVVALLPRWWRMPAPGRAADDRERDEHASSPVAVASS